MTSSFTSKPPDQPCDKTNDTTHLQQENTKLPQGETIAAWLLDLDGTLYHPRPIKLCMGLELLTNPRVIPVLREFRKQHQQLREQQYRSTNDTSHSPFEEQIKRVCDKMHLPHDQVRQIVLEWMVAKPGKWIRLFQRRKLIDQVREFRDRGGKTAIVSDYPATEKLTAMGISHLFDVVIASGEPDGPTALKPYPEGFLRAAQRLGIEPQRCMVIGDRADADGEAAAAAGMGFRLIR